MPKPKSKTAANKKVSSHQAEKLADALSDKPYGSSKNNLVQESLTRLTISLPQSLFDALEEESRAKRKRGEKDWSMSAIVRDVIAAHLKC